MIKNYKKSCLYFLLAYIFYLFPIIKADRYFIDDFNRSFLGYLSWSDNGRPMADVVMSVLNFGTIISDISPLTQILGVLSLLTVVFFLLKTCNINSYQVAMCAMCVIVSPFLMETLSYAYDSLTMLLSISILFLAFIPKISKKYVEFLWHFSCVTISLCLYQASLGIYVVIALISYFENKNEESPSFRQLSTYAISFISSYAFYAKIIAPIFISGGYSTKRSEMINFSDPKSFLHFYDNLIKYIDFILLAYPKPFMVVVLLLVSLGYAGVIKKAILYFREKTTPAYIAAIISILSPLIIFVICVAPLSVLSNPPMMSRVLTIVGVATLFFMYYSFTLFTGTLKKVPYAISILFFVYSYATIYAYGNAQTREKAFEEYIIGMMQSDLSNISDSDNFDIYGTAPVSPVSSLIVSQHPIMAWAVLSNITFRDEWRTNIALSNYKFKWKYKIGSYTGSIDNPECKFLAKKYNGYYTTFKKDGVVLFHFKESCK